MIVLWNIRSLQISASPSHWYPVWPGSVNNVSHSLGTYCMPGTVTFPGRIIISILYRSKMRPKRLNDLPSQRGRQWESQNAELGSHTPKSSLSSWWSPNKPWYLTYKMRRDGNLCRVRDQTSSQPHESLSLIIMEKWLSNYFLLNIVQGFWKTTQIFYGEYFTDKFLY